MDIRRALRRLRPGAGAAAPSPAPAAAATEHAHPHYSEAELLERAEEFNRNAERHWRAIVAEADGRSHALNKPFANVRDAPAMLYRLGLVLTELDLGVGMTVLDFGAGSCWLSACLNRLRCRTVAVDVSPTALALGRDLFDSDPRQRLELEPQFLAYDGRTIPVPDASVDRAVCFDSFHHVPNQDRVLAELYRVLAPGGRLVLAEPGEGHSHQDQSQFETETYGVLENDLHLPELVERARAAGFDRVGVKPFPDAAAFSFGFETYRDFMDGNDAAYPLPLVREKLRHFFIVSLGKGAPSVDSRNPRLLRAELAVLGDAALAGVAAKTLAFRVRVRNAGDTLWRHQPSPSGGHVLLGGHLLDEHGLPFERGVLRQPLPRDLAPGDSVEIAVEMFLPPKVGRYALKLDMVDEYVAWFEACGSPTLTLPLDVGRYPDSRDPHRLAVELALCSGAPERPLTPGAPIALRLRLANSGDSGWLAGAAGEHGAVSIGAHLVDAHGRELVRDYARAPLPFGVLPGEELELPFELAAPPETGRFRLRLDLVAEGVCWFEHMGSRPLELPIETSADVPDSRQPGLLRAALEVLEAPHSATAGAQVRLALRVRNAGNTLWRGGAKAHGVVGVGGRLFAEGVLREPDFLRGPLPSDVAPGAQLDLTVAFAAPAEPGDYALELDMVDEGICWFASRGSPTARVALTVR